MPATYLPKEKFIQRMRLLLNDEEDLKKFFSVGETRSKKAIRVNTLKITVEELKELLQKKQWQFHQPYKNNPEIIIIDSILEPGALGKAVEHILGYYYIQEITSMMPIFALQPKENELMLDLCASPGSKTTQAAAMMKNAGTIIANDVSGGRISILAANLERCGVANAIVTLHSGFELGEKLKKLYYQFDKILLDAPCSGEGNVRNSPRTYLEWSEGLLKMLSRKQKKLASIVASLLKKEGELLYSTCTYAPEENEEIVQYLLDNFPLEISFLSLPLKTRPGITHWKNKTFSPSMSRAARIYHHDNDLEGFFVCKLRKI
ncbi:MAG: RsmB/NOP family class I SAM-dependent RNA methyltransferase [Nanoarchaeota archaeon]